MDIAAIILSTMAMLMSVGTLIIMVGKHYFSSHVIQYKPIDDMFQSPIPTGKPMEDAFRDFDQLSPEEEEYFRQQKHKI